jgi:hypothetical protein
LKTETKPSVWGDAEPQTDSPNCPGPGIYEDVSFADYCDWDAINHSKLYRIDKSPLNTQIGPDFSGSSSIRFGQLVHTGRLEPESVSKRYAVMPAFENDAENETATGKPSTSTATQYVKECRKAFAKMNATKTVISQAEYNDLNNALDAINACPQAVERLSNGSPETSIVWHDQATGLRCKARIDFVGESHLADLKTSRDDKNTPLPESFEYSLWTYSYYSQAAWYQSGWEALTGARLPFWFVVLGTGSPMQCVAAPVGEMTLRLGRDKNKERLALYKLCHDRGEFPGYESPEIFELPDKYFPDEVV